VRTGNSSDSWQKSAELQLHRVRLQQLLLQLLSCGWGDSWQQCLLASVVAKKGRTEFFTAANRLQILESNSSTFPLFSAAEGVCAFPFDVAVASQDAGSSWLSLSIRLVLSLGP